MGDALVKSWRDALPERVGHMLAGIVDVSLHVKQAVNNLGIRLCLHCRRARGGSHCENMKAGKHSVQLALDCKDRGTEARLASVCSPPIMLLELKPRRRANR